MILKRTTLGYEVRAVGFNPEAARYGGISVKRSMIASMAICGAFAGLAGAVQVLGVHVLDRRPRRARLDIGFTGIAVALLGRNHGRRHRARGAAVRRAGHRRAAALGRVQPRARGRVSTIIQGTIILLVGGELVVRWLVARAKRERAEIPTTTAGPSPPSAAAPPPGVEPA